jgi:hypothetical protein
MGVITMDTIALVDKYPEADERVIAHEIDLWAAQQQLQP